MSRFLADSISPQPVLKGNGADKKQDSERYLKRGKGRDILRKQKVEELAPWVQMCDRRPCCL